MVDVVICSIAGYFFGALVWTDLVLEDQIVHFDGDIYDQDAELDRVLDKGYPYRR